MSGMPDMDIMDQITRCRNNRDEYLSLEISPGDSIPDALCELTWLKSLQFYIRSQATLPKEIGKLNQLEELYVLSGEFDCLPERICNLTLLKTLEVKCSLLRVLPQNIGQLKNLTRVSFYATKIEELPESIGELQNLNTLALNECHLISLPASMGNLSNLKSIQLTGNNLTAIPEEFGNLKQLKELYLANNELTEVPPCIQKLTSLTEVVLHNNRITSIPSWLDENISGLTEESIKPDPFSVVKESYYTEGLALYENLFDIFPVLNKEQEKRPDLDQKALQAHEMNVLNQNALSSEQREAIENFLKYYLMPENEEISYVIEKYSTLNRRLSKKEGAPLLQELLFEEPAKITADEKETIVSFWEASFYGYMKHVNYDLLADYIRSYRAKEVAPYSYWSPFNPSILCFDVSCSFGYRVYIDKCPVCASDITTTERKVPTVAGAEFNNKASMPHVQTKLYVCPVCRWWAVSELVQDFECNQSGEAFFTCGIKTDTNDSEENIRRKIQEMYNDTSHPWSPVFREQQYWAKAKKMTREEAIWLFGEDQISDTYSG